MNQVICLKEGCCNIVIQTSKYTKRKYCSDDCRDFANNNKWQEKRKEARKLGIVKKKYVGSGIKMGFNNEDTDFGCNIDFIKNELNIINQIENKYIKNNQTSTNKEPEKQNVNITYTKPKQSIKKKQRGLFDYIFDKWQIVNHNTSRAIKHYVNNVNYQLCLF